MGYLSAYLITNIYIHYILFQNIILKCVWHILHLLLYYESFHICSVKRYGILTFLCQHWAGRKDRKEGSYLVFYPVLTPTVNICCCKAKTSVICFFQGSYVTSPPSCASHHDTKGRLPFSKYCLFKSFSFGSLFHYII